jgi:hypothetical protein
MSRSTLLSPLDPTPDRPTTGVGPPSRLLEIEVDVTWTHLGNPLVAVARLLASEAEAHARVVGDEDRFTVTVALPEASAGAAARAEAWVRWAVHNAGVRGRLARRDDGHEAHELPAHPASTPRTTAEAAVRDPDGPRSPGRT